MLVLFKLETGYVGEACQEVYEFDNDTSDETLDEYGQELAYDNARMYGRDNDEDLENVSHSWEKLNMTREEAEEEYGSVCEA